MIFRQDYTKPKHKRMDHADKPTLVLICMVWPLSLPLYILFYLVKAGGEYLAEDSDDLRAKQDAE